MNPATEALLVGLARAGSSVGLIVLFTILGLFNPSVPADWTKGEVWNVTRLVLGAGGATLGSMWKVGRGRRGGFLFLGSLVAFYVMLHLYDYFTNMPPPEDVAWVYHLTARVTFFLNYLFFGICTGEIVAFISREYSPGKKKPV